MSLDNQYEYCWNYSFNTKGDGAKEYVGGLFIYGPRFTDYSDEEEAYVLAHELGHHYVNKKMNPFLLRLSLYKLPFLEYKTEQLAWIEAEKICLQESINVGNNFYRLRNVCLNTYKNALKKWINHIFKFWLHIFISYYCILLTLYLACKCNNENVYDIFGLLQLFRGVNLQSIFFLSKIFWGIYIVYHTLRFLIKLIVYIIKIHRTRII